MLVFYTDGIPEATSPEGDFYGMERFYSALRKNCGGGTEAAVEQVKENVVLYQGDHQFDDITLMMFARK